MSSIGYAIACVVLPAAWGIAVSRVFGFVHRRRSRHERVRGDPPPVDYSI
ncbi:MAG: hypothetical protein ABSC94_06615 [Polyangiaceae bacterium]